MNCKHIFNPNILGLLGFGCVTTGSPMVPAQESYDIVLKKQALFARMAVTPTQSQGFGLAMAEHLLLIGN